MQTRSKFRLIQQAVAQVPSSQELASSPPKASKEKKRTKKKKAPQSAQPLSSSSIDSPIAPTTEMVYDELNLIGGEQEHVNITGTAEEIVGFLSVK